MSVQPLLDAAGRRRSPATTPGFRCTGIASRNKGSATPPTRRPLMGSSPSCAKPAMIAVAIGSLP